MKRFFCILAAAVLAAMPIVAAEPNSREVKTYDVDYFDALEVSWIYKVDLKQSRSQSVTIEAPDFIMEYIDVKVRKSRLVLSIKDMPLSLRTKIETGKYEVLATVSMRKLSSIEMSGTSKLYVDGQFHSDDDVFKMDISGASAVKDLNITAQSADIECTGAAKFEMTGKFKDVKAYLSGAAKGELETDTKALDAKVGGASNLSYRAGDKFQLLDTDIARGATLRRL